MTDSKISYVGPLPRLSAPSGAQKSLFKKLPIAFLIVVGLPTLIAAVYFLFMASPRYVSETTFVVRAAAQPQVSAIGAALQGVGLSAGSTDAYAVHEYIRSADGMRELTSKIDVKAMYSRGSIDVFSRIPRPFSDSSEETFRKQFNKYVVVGYDSQTGISTLRVQAFRARDAQTLNTAMLAAGEGLVNRLNSRAAADAVADSRRTVEEATRRLADAQAALTSFRNREGVIDPARSAQARGELIAELTLNLTTLRAERSQVAADAPNSPQLPMIDSRIRALQQQIDAQEAQVTGEASSLAPKISNYETLVMEREFADRLLAAATASLNSAELDSRRQKLYIERIVNPTLPDAASEPKRWLSILAVLATCLLIYAIGWLIMSSVKESRLHE